MEDVTDKLIQKIRTGDANEPAVTIIGDLNYDYIYTSPPLESGKEVIISNVCKELAGAAGYVSCGMAKLGANVSFLSDLGEDEEGRRLKCELEDKGVQCADIHFKEGKKTPFTLIFLEQNELLPRQSACFPGVLADFIVGPERFQKNLTGSDLIYSCNYFIMPALKQELPALFAKARRSGAITSYDANAGDGWEIPAALKTLRDGIYPKTDIIFLNEFEAAHLTGERDPLKGIHLVNQESRIVIIKLGVNGAVIRDGSSIFKINAFPHRQKITDTVGAGDSFQAAFLYFYLKKYSTPYCAVLASANAASTVLYKGGTTGQLDKEGLVNFLADYVINESEDNNIEIDFRNRL